VRVEAQGTHTIVALRSPAGYDQRHPTNDRFRATEPQRLTRHSPWLRRTSALRPQMDPGAGTGSDSSTGGWSPQKQQVAASISRRHMPSNTSRQALRRHTSTIPSTLRRYHRNATPLGRCVDRCYPDAIHVSRRADRSPYHSAPAPRRAVYRNTLFDGAPPVSENIAGRRCADAIELPSGRSGF
jgi:hypothetical protein